MTDLHDQATALGILPVYRDTTGQMRQTSADTAKALIAAMAPSDAPLPTDVICVAGRSPNLSLPNWTLTLEDGQQSEGTGPLPALPLGIHRAEAGGTRYTLLSAPARLPLPKRAWGMIVPLYGLSAAGIGTYNDLADWCEALAPSGAGFVGLNPVHAGFPSDPGLFSPYTPSHRRRLNVMHLPGGAGTPGPRVDYARDVPARMAALRAACTPEDPEFLAWRRAQGDSITRFACHQALSFRHGPLWESWPTDLRDPKSPAVARAAEELQEELTFHAWLQYRAEMALQAAQTRATVAGMRHGIYLDLAVGTHPYGAETWEDRDSFAFGASLGAPPDAFSADGQNWNLAPFNPQTLRAKAYAPLAETLRRQLALSGLMRIDHILGFERAFWVPSNGAPGAYVQMPRDTMLAVIRIEAARANASVIGEDLGNIPDGLRDALRASGIMGCRVAMFERTRWGRTPRFRKPGGYDAAAIASFSTHDLPTWDGWRSGADITARTRIDGSDTSEVMAQRQRDVAAFDATADDLHGFLAQTRSRLVAVQIENVLGLTDQPNLPGTVTEYPNWQFRLPVQASSLARHDAVTRIGQTMRQANRT